MSTMAKRVVLMSVVFVLLAACSSIPDKSVFTPLDSKELAKAMKSDSLFERFYADLREDVEDFNEIEKAKFSDITYRKLFKDYSFLEDTAIANPLYRQWRLEWDTKYGSFESKVDSVIEYWQDYKRTNGLDRFASVEFAVLDKDYYSYSYDVKDVNLGFRLTPFGGTIEQVKFTYRYSAKINKYYGEKHNCISTTPFSFPVIRYWEVDYSDEKTLKNLTTESFIRDYDIDIEITDVRKDGVNYRLSDLYIPSSVESYLDNKLEVMESYYREKIIEELICKDYVRLYEYLGNQKKDLLRSKFPRESVFMEYVEDR